MINSELSPKGSIEIIIDRNGKKEIINFKNTVVRKGRAALASCLSNDIGDTFEFYINRMIFGDGGTDAGTPKYVNSERNGLFGSTVATQTIMSTINPDDSTQVTFTSVLTYDDANGSTLNEMALRMSNGDLYSMATFADLNKTSSMQLTINWNLYFV